MIHILGQKNCTYSKLFYAVHFPKSKLIEIIYAFSEHFITLAHTMYLGSLNR